MVVLPVMVALIFAAVPVHDVVPEPIAPARPAGLIGPPAAAPERPRPVTVRRSRQSRPEPVHQLAGRWVPVSGPAASAGFVPAPVRAASIALSPPAPVALATPRPRFVGFPVIAVPAAPSRAAAVMAVAVPADARTQAP